jgi:hypothetical protein
MNIKPSISVHVVQDLRFPPEGVPLRNSHSHHIMYTASDLKLEVRDLVRRVTEKFKTDFNIYVVMEFYPSFVQFTSSNSISCFSNLHSEPVFRSSVRYEVEQFILGQLFTKVGDG